MAVRGRESRHTILHNISYQTLVLPQGRPAPGHSTLADPDVAGFELPQDFPQTLDQFLFFDPGLRERQVQLEGAALGPEDEGEALEALRLKTREFASGVRRES